MASPNFDSLVVEFSRRIDDAVASASSDGSLLTSVKRVSYVNRGIRTWMKKIADANMLRLDKGLAADWNRVRGYVTYTTGTIDSSKKIAVSAFSPTAFYVVGVFNTTDHLDILPIPPGRTRIDLQNETNTLRTGQHYEWDSGDLYVINGTSADAYAIEYVKDHADLSAGGSTDIVITSEYWDEILTEASILFYQEYPSDKNTAKLMVLKNG